MGAGEVFSRPSPGSFWFGYRNQKHSSKGRFALSQGSNPQAPMRLKTCGLVTSNLNKKDPPKAGLERAS